MTRQLETRFICDRCYAETNVAMSDLPSTVKNIAPEGWLALWRTQITDPAVHLCRDCNFSFHTFMHAKKATGEQD